MMELPKSKFLAVVENLLIFPLLAWVHSGSVSTTSYSHRPKLTQAEFVEGGTVGPPKPMLSAE